MPGCGASWQERTLVKMDDRGCEAIHLRYTCNKCRKTVVEEFTLDDVFIDDGT
jgi:transposase-like protein